MNYNLQVLFCFACFVLLVLFFSCPHTIGFTMPQSDTYVAYKLLGRILKVDIPVDGPFKYSSSTVLRGQYPIFFTKA